MSHKIIIGIYVKKKKKKKMSVKDLQKYIFDNFFFIIILFSKLNNIKE